MIFCQSIAKSPKRQFTIIHCAKGSIKLIIISVNNISLSFGTNEILRDVSFALNETDKLGIIGVNGCGKSTLFRIILGEAEPDSGNIYISKQKSVGILRQNDAFADFTSEDGESTALDVMYGSFPELLAQEKELAELEKILHDGSAHNERTAALYSEKNEKFIRDGGLEFRSRCASTLAKMGFDEESMHRPYSSLSGGQRTRLALSRELCREPDLLMLDEPTNHLDIETLTWLEAYLVSYKKCLMVISHDRYFLDRVTNKTLAIEHHTAKLYNGGYSRSMEQRKTDAEIEMRHYKNQQKEIARQEAYIAQQRRWNRERNIIAAESRLKMLDKMQKLERPKEALRPIKMQFTSALESGNEVLKIKNISFGYDPSHQLLKNFSLLVGKRERLFIVGSNGCGKSTLIKLLLGKLTPDSGYIEAGYNVVVGYYDQENQNLTDDNTVLDELWNAYPQMDETPIRSTLAMFRFTGDGVFKKVAVLSGGERARLTLAKLLLSEMNLLILDEPTNHLDIDSREALEVALSEFDGTIITVSHDRYFIDKLATRIVDIVPPSSGDCRIFNVEHIGKGYTELCLERERAVARSTDADANTSAEKETSYGKEQYLKSKRDAAEQKKLKRNAEKLAIEAKKLEAELEAIESEMNGDAATDYIRLAELDTRKNEIEERLLEIYEETGI